MKTELTLYLSSIILSFFFIIEALFSADFRRGLKGKIKYRNIAYIISSLLVIFLMSKISKYLSSLDLISLEVYKFPLIDFVGCFLIAELLNWLLHYIKHQGFFWKFHFQHHLDKRYTVLLTAHTHGIEVLLSGILIGIMMNLIGFSIEAINLYYCFYVFGNTYQHSSFNLSLGPLDKVIVSPRYHRIHHSKSNHANFGSTLTIWDIVFKTAKWPKSDEVVKDIGINQKDEPIGFLKETFFFLKN